jgi:hypothetical protein
MSVFVSHASEDDLTVDRIYRLLAAADIEAWVDHLHIDGGDRWNEKIDTALFHCQYGLLVISEAFLESQFCEGEWQKLHNCQKKLFIALIDQSIPPSRLPVPLNSIHCIDLHTNFEDGIAKLIRILRRQVLPIAKPPISDDPLSPSGFVGDTTVVVAPPTEKTRVKLTFNMSFKDTNPQKIDAIRQLISVALNAGIDDINIVDVSEGSLIVTIEMSSELADELLALIQENPDLFEEFELEAVETVPVVSDESYSTFYVITRRVIQL